MKNWTTIREELLRHPEVKREYDKLEPEYNLAESLIQARIDKKLTQKELAEKAGISQVMVSRLESGITNPTVGTVTRVASVLGKKLKLVG
jgi:predicted transcriptional regulator